MAGRNRCKPSLCGGSGLAHDLNPAICDHLMQEEAWVLDLGCLSRHHAAQVQRYRRLALLMQPQGLISFKLFGFDF